MDQVTNRVKTLYHEEHVMGTVVTFDVYPGEFSDEDLLRESIESAVTILHDADDVFSTWKSESPLSRLRRGEIELIKHPLSFAKFSISVRWPVRFRMVGLILGRSRAASTLRDS